MKASLEPRRECFVSCSGHIVLECHCGERLVLLGQEEDWYSERTIFRCECGQSLTFAANHLAEEALGLGKLLRSLREEGPDLRDHLHQGP